MEHEIYTWIGVDGLLWYVMGAGHGDGAEREGETHDVPVDLHSNPSFGYELWNEIMDSSSQNEFPW